MELLVVAVLVVIIVANVAASRRNGEWHVHQPWRGPPVMRKKVDGKWIARPATEGELSDWGHGASGW